MQHEAKMKTLKETLRQSNLRRRNLGEEMDRLQKKVWPSLPAG